MVHNQNFQTLKLSSNQKVNFFKGHQNTYGLDPVTTCPGATRGKHGCLGNSRGGAAPTCYALKMIRIYPYYQKTVSDNTERLVGKSKKEMIEVLSNTVMKFLLQNAGKEQFFRHHTSGDFFSLEYAEAWAEVMHTWPMVRFWGYTRSFTDDLNVVPVLAECKNMATYLSLDLVNLKAGLKVYDPFIGHTNVAMAYMGEPPLKLTKQHKFVCCPDLNNALDENHRPKHCGDCRLCFNQTETRSLRNIWFPIH